MNTLFCFHAKFSVHPLITYPIFILWVTSLLLLMLTYYREKSENTAFRHHTTEQSEKKNLMIIKEEELGYQIIRRNCKHVENLTIRV